MSRCRGVLAAAAFLICAAASGALAQPVETAPPEETAPEEAPPELPAPEPPAPEPPAPPAAVELPVEIAPEAAAASAVDPARPALEVTGSFFTRYELRHHYDRVGLVGGRIGELDATAYRARLGLTTTPVDVGKGRAVVIGMTPQVSGFWGPSGALADAAVGVHEARLRIQDDTSWLDLGRFEMVYGDHFVIGNVDWHETGRSFDGGRLHLAVGDRGAWVDAFLTMISEGSPAIVTPFGAGDQYFTGVYAGLGPMVGAGVDVDAYLLNRVWPAIDGGSELAYESTVGGRLKQKIGKVELRVEAGAQLGKNVLAEDVLAFGGEGEVGFKASDQLLIAGQAFFASGDGDATDGKDQAWDQLFPTAHKWLGLMDVIGARSNVMGAAGKGRYQASPELALALDLHCFLRPQTGPAVDGYTGVEADAWAAYKLGKDLGVRGQYGLFVPSETGPLGADALIHYVEIELRYDLK